MSILKKLQLVELSSKFYSFKIISNSKQLRFNSTSSEEAASEEKSSDAEPKKKERVFFKDQEEIDGFKVFDVYMNKKVIDTFKAKKEYVKTEVDEFARCNKMPVDQDWTNVWPSATFFKQSAVPLPVRQGYSKNMSENDGLPPVKYGNTELIKIPNFLHLTPPHIKKQCAAIKKFCTKWPVELKTDDDCREHFPIEITTSNYIYDGPSLRDDRARVVTLQIKLSSLDLNQRQKHKFITLSKEHYDPKTDILTLVGNRCPYRKQNEEYVMYLLTTLYFESKQIEDWEDETITEDDLLVYDWSKTKSKQNILNLMSKIENKDQEKLIDSEKVINYKNNIEKIFNEGESIENMEDYKNSVLSILNINNKKNENAKL